MIKQVSNDLFQFSISSQAVTPMEVRGTNTDSLHTSVQGEGNTTKALVQPLYTISTNHLAKSFQHLVGGFLRIHENTNDTRQHADGQTA